MSATARLAIVLVLAAAAAAGAHDRSVSYSEWQIDGAKAEVRFRISALDASWIAADAAADETPADYFSRRLILSSGSEPCRLEAPPRALSPGEWLAYEWRLACASSADLAIESRILVAVAPGHLHFAHVHGGDGGGVDHVLTVDAPRRDLGAASEPAARGLGLGAGLALGVEHVLSGFDHLAFLAALCVGASGVAGILAMATAFTVAHSLTLVAAALGYLVPDPGAIEPLIGLSIALVAAENLLSRDASAARARGLSAALIALAILAACGIGSVPALTLLGLALLVPATLRLAARRHALGRGAVAFLFGLIHGFGFAAVLGEARLEGRALLTALLGFNLGVEVGQVLVVAALAAALVTLRARSAAAHRSVEREASVLLLALGVAWFVARAY